MFARLPSNIIPRMPNPSRQKGRNLISDTSSFPCAEASPPAPFLPAPCTHLKVIPHGTWQYLFERRCGMWGNRPNW